MSEHSDLIDMVAIRGAIYGLMPDQQPSILEIAKRLDTSPRTIQRHLAREGKTFSQLVDSVLQHYACAMLVNSSLSVGEIARRLGYRQASSFSRAFRGWTSMTPSDYRRRHAVFNHVAAGGVSLWRQE